MPASLRRSSKSRPSRPRARPPAAAAAALLACALALVVPQAARAEAADREKPINIEADRLVYDDQKQVSTFTGNVVLTKGTIEIRADRLQVRQDPEGWQHGTAWGEPATFRQKREGVEEWIEGKALRIDYDGRKQTVRLQQQAMMQRTAGGRVLDEVHGNEILYESGSEYFTVEGGDVARTPENPSGRVRMVIQPRKDAEPAQGPSTQLKPAERLSPGTR